MKLSVPRDKCQEKMPREQDEAESRRKRCNGNSFYARASMPKPANWGNKDEWGEMQTVSGGNATCWLDSPRATALTSSAPTLKKVASRCSRGGSARFCRHPSVATLVTVWPTVRPTVRTACSGTSLVSIGGSLNMLIEQGAGTSKR